MQPVSDPRPPSAMLAAIGAGAQNAFSIGRAIGRTFSTWRRRVGAFSALRLGASLQLLRICSVGAAFVAAACGGGSSGDPGAGGGACTLGHAPIACWNYAPGIYFVAARVPVTLESCSYSYEGAPLAHAWAITSTPATSAAASISTGAPSAVVVTDVEGDYTIALTVTDSCGSSTFSYPIHPMEWAPYAYAGVDRVAAVGASITLDGTGSSDRNLDPLTYAWTITGAPNGSTAALTGADSAAPRLTPDEPGVYEVTLEVFDGRSTDTDVVWIYTYHPALKAQVQPWDVEYSAGLDRLVVLEDGGSSLWIVNPHDASTTEVPLTDVAYAVAVSGDGLHAAASHAGKLSWVDLATGTVERVLTTASDGGDVVLPSTGYFANTHAFVFPRLTQSIGVQQIALDGTSQGFNVGADAEASPARKPRLSTTTGHVYAIGADDEFDPYYFSYDGLNYYNVVPDYQPKGNGPWLSPDGGRIYVGSGWVYQASGDLVTRVSGTLSLPSDTNGLRWVDDSATGGILVVSEHVPYATTAPVRLHDRATLAVVRELPAPAVFAADAIERGTPVYAFWKPDGSGFYVVTQQGSGTSALGIAEY